MIADKHNENEWFKGKELIIPDIIRLNRLWHGNKTALICDDKSLNWKELGENINKIGNLLYGLNIKQGDRIVLMTRNSGEMMQIILGIICAGLVVVPLNISINDNAIINMVNNCDAKAIVASDEFVERIDNIREEFQSSISDRYICLNNNGKNWHDYHQLLKKSSNKSLNITISPSDECNIIYSSGTTGLPKGIVHNHSCRMAWAESMSVSLRYHSGARTLLSLGLYSNISWVAFLNTIFTAGTMYVAKKFDARDCLRLIQDNEITHFAMVPVQYQMLLSCENFSDFNISSIKAMMCCGSPLSVDMKKNIMQNFPGDFIELYGLTEGLVTILGPEDMEQKIDSVGKPYPGQDIRIIDNDNKELSHNNSGEIVGISKIMMSGYLNNQQANMDATWLDENQGRWLRTGDIGRLDEDGFLYLVDRKKDMIISGGQNIYPADIESVLSQRRELKEVAVIGVTSKKWGETPIALVVANKNKHIDVDEIKQWLNSRLGKQQRVSAVLMIKSLPRNPAGKILKRELRKRYLDLGL